MVISLKLSVNLLNMSANLVNMIQIELLEPKLSNLEYMLNVMG